jgi:hypothetical protein
LFLFPLACAFARGADGFDHLGLLALASAGNAFAPITVEEFASTVAGAARHARKILALPFAVATRPAGAKDASTAAGFAFANPQQFVDYTC